MIIESSVRPIGGFYPICPELVSFCKEKELIAQEKMKEVMNQVQSPEQGLNDSIASLNLSGEKSEAVVEAISNIAKTNVQDIQGVYYETYD